MTKIIGIPLGWIMYGIYSFCKDYGISLILFALLTKLILLPLSVKSLHNNAKMRALNPKLEKLKKSYANNPQKFQEEQMKLFNEEGVNQFSGCLPLLIQFPILFGIVDVVYSPLKHILRLSSDVISSATDILSRITETDMTKNRYVELEIVKYASDPKYQHEFEQLGDSFISKITEFQSNEYFLGFIDLGSKADFHPNVWTAGAVALIVIPIITGLINLITTIVSQQQQKKQNPTAASMGSGMNAMMYGMSIFYIWMTFKFPSGAAFYWAVSGLFGLIQTISLNAYYTNERCAIILEKDKEKNKDKKPGFMQKIMEQQQEMLAQQNGNGSAQNAVKVSKGDFSKSELNEMNRKAINEARKRMAEKYGDEYSEDEN